MLIGMITGVIYIPKQLQPVCGTWDADRSLGEEEDVGIGYNVILIEFSAGSTNQRSGSASPSSPNSSSENPCSRSLLYILLAVPVHCIEG